MQAEAELFSGEKGYSQYLWRGSQCFQHHAIQTFLLNQQLVTTWTETECALVVLRAKIEYFFKSAGFDYLNQNRMCSSVDKQWTREKVKRQIERGNQETCLALHTGIKYLLKSAVFGYLNQNWMCSSIEKQETRDKVQRRTE